MNLYKDTRIRYIQLKAAKYRAFAASEHETAELAFQSKNTELLQYHLRQRDLNAAAADALDEIVNTLACNTTQELKAFCKQMEKDLTAP